MPIRIVSTIMIHRGAESRSNGDLGKGHTNRQSQDQVRAIFAQLPEELQQVLGHFGKIIELRQFPTGEHNDKTVVGVICRIGPFRRRIIGKHTVEEGVLGREIDGLAWAENVRRLRRRVIRPQKVTNNVIISRWFLNNGGLRDLVGEDMIPFWMAQRIRAKYLEMNMRAWDNRSPRMERARRGLKNRGRFSMQHAELPETLEHKDIMVRNIGQRLGIDPELVGSAVWEFQIPGQGAGIEDTLSINDLFAKIERVPQMENPAFLRWGNLDLASKNLLVRFGKIFGIAWWRWKPIDWEMAGQMNIGEALAVALKLMVFSQKNLPGEINWSFNRDNKKIMVMANTDVQIRDNVWQLEAETWKQIKDYTKQTDNNLLLAEVAFCLGWNYLHAAAYAADPSVAVFNIRQASRWMKIHDQLAGNVSVTARRGVRVD